MRAHTLPPSLGIRFVNMGLSTVHLMVPPLGRNQPGPFYPAFATWYPGIPAPFRDTGRIGLGGSLRQPQAHFSPKFMRTAGFRNFPPRQRGHLSGPTIPPPIPVAAAAAHCPWTMEPFGSRIALQFWAPLARGRGPERGTSFPGDPYTARG